MRPALTRSLLKSGSRGLSLAVNRFLQWLNLFGVAALAALCLIQWQVNRRLNLELNRCEELRLELAGKLAKEAQISADRERDLASFRTHLARLSDEVEKTASAQSTAERDLRDALAARDQLKSSFTNLASAVAARDARLAEAAAQLTALLKERDDAIMRFNELAERHNSLVKEWNDLQARLKEGPPNRGPNR